MFGPTRLRIFAALAAGAVIAGVGVGVSNGLVTDASLPHPIPAVGVSPNVNLVDLQNVLVVGGNFSPNASLGTVECEPGAIDESSCDLSTLVYTSANEKGAMLLRRPVRRIISVGGSNVDCAAPASCILGVGNIADLTEAAGAPISFDPNVPPVVPKLAAVPSTKLRDHQLVTVVGSGFNPGSSIQVSECASNGFDCAYETFRFGDVNDKGNVVIRNFALERLIQSYDENGPVTIDCAATPTTCVLQAQTSGFGGGVVNASLAFDPRIPPVVPALSVSPSTNLGDLQLVNVSGYGFLPGVQVNISECAQDTFACDPGSRTATAGFQGQFTITMAVHRRLAAQGQLGIDPTDCAAHLGACLINAYAQGTNTAPSVALGFNPRKPAVNPSMLVVPNTGLVDNQRVGIVLNGFGAFGQTAVVECSADAVADQNLSYCDPSTELVTTTPANASAPTLSFFVHRQIAGQDGLVDCAAKAGACVLVALPYQFFGYFGGVSNGSLGAGAKSTTSAQPAPAARNAFGLPLVGGKALPGPTLAGRAALAVPGSSIPGIAVQSLSFRP
jgi:hypothetical protein